MNEYIWTTICAGDQSPVARSVTWLSTYVSSKVRVRCGINFFYKSLTHRNAQEVRVFTLRILVSQLRTLYAIFLIYFAVKCTRSLKKYAVDFFSESSRLSSVGCFVVVLKPQGHRFDPGWLTTFIGWCSIITFAFDENINTNIQKKNSASNKWHYVMPSVKCS